MINDDIEKRLLKAETKIDLLVEHITPRPMPFWKRLLSLETVRNLLYLVGLPVTILLAYDSFDREILNAQKNRNLEQKNIAIDRLDKLQDIKTEIYRLQSEGNETTAFAIIEGKRGRIERLTDAVYSAWKEQPEMLRRYDLNALAEALLEQGRTDHALEVAQVVETSTLGPIDQIDQLIFNARIQFALGPAHDMEAARDHLRAAIPVVEKIEREGNKMLMMEKISTIRLSNEFWRNTGCEKLLQIADGLRLINAENIAAGHYKDQFGVEITLQGVAQKCG